MMQYSKYYNLIVFILLLGCSCTPIITPQVEGIKPVWSTKLPGEAGIYNDGLIGLPLYDGKIIFHSTYFTNFEEEDNRIHALDVETGKILWTFPSQYKKENSMFFLGVPFLKNEYLVAKMPTFGNTLPYDRLICINLETGKEVWNKSFLTSFSNNVCYDDIVGNENDFYFFQQTENNALLYKGNLLTGDTTVYLKIIPETPSNFSETTSNAINGVFNNKDIIVTGGLERIKNNRDIYDFNTFLYLIDLNKKDSINKIPIILPDKGNPINRIYLYNQKVYLVYGRTSSCYNTITSTIEWTFTSVESFNFMTNHIVVNDNIVFLYGDNRYVGLNAETGEKLYQGDIQCGNADAFNGYVYIIGRDGYLYILDIKSGKQLHKITCPTKYTEHDGFSTGCKPQVYGDKLYVFSYKYAYCYDAEPKE